MDEKDNLILSSLIKDASMRYDDLAFSLGLPKSTVHARVRRMKQKGIIRQIVALPDYKKLGMEVTAFILISFLPGRFGQREVAKKIAALPGVFEVHLIAGEWDILLKVRGTSTEEIGRLVIDKLRGIEGVGRSVTCTCFSTVREVLWSPLDLAEEP